MMAVSMKTRPSISVVRILPSASGCREMPSADLLTALFYGEVSEPAPKKAKKAKATKKAAA